MSESLAPPICLPPLADKTVPVLGKGVTLLDQAGPLPDATTSHVNQETAHLLYSSSSQAADCPPAESPPPKDSFEDCAEPHDDWEASPSSAQAANVPFQMAGRLPSEVAASLPLDQEGRVPSDVAVNSSLEQAAAAATG